MVLTSTTTVDLIGQTQTLIFYQSVSQIDQMTFSSNQVTWQNTSGYNLSKSDTLLFFQFLNIYKTLLLINFPTLYQSINTAFPLSSFSLTETSVGVTHINYAQTSQGNSILALNYVPIGASAAVASRSAFAISVQEFLFSIDVLSQFNQQVSLN